MIFKILIALRIAALTALIESILGSSLAFLTDGKTLEINIQTKTAFDDESFFKVIFNDTKVDDKISMSFKVNGQKY